MKGQQAVGDSLWKMSTPSEKVHAHSERCGMHIAPTLRHMQIARGHNSVPEGLKLPWKSERI